MRIIDWNLSWLKNSDKKIDYLLKHTNNHSFVVILQEVTQSTYEALCESFSTIANIEYSLNYRVPGKYDTSSRKLGIAILTSKDIKISNAQVLDRTIMPDRTLMIDAIYNGQPLRIIGLHSITGCQHGKAKEIQYFSFAEAISEYMPDIVGIDANEPELDHYDISQMQFFDNYNKGNGCKTFFMTMSENSLEDAFVKNYDKTLFVHGEYLTTSHIIQRGKKSVRYDFLFVNKLKFNEYNCSYYYEEAIEAGSDHAAIILQTANDEERNEFKWNQRIKKARKELGITQEELANRMDVHRSTIANYELGRRKPTFIELKKLAEILHVDINYLFESDSPDSPTELINRVKNMFLSSEFSQDEKDSLFQEICEVYTKEKTTKDN